MSDAQQPEDPRPGEGERVDEGAARTAPSPTPGLPVEGSQAFLSCRIGAVWIALPVAHVAEVAEVAEHTAVPLAGPHILGVFNRRGHVIPLVDLGRFLELGEAAPAGAEDSGPGGAETALRRIVVVTADEMRVGLLADRVRDIVSVSPEQVRPPDIVRGERLREYARAEIALEGLVLAVLDVGRLLEAARVQ